MISLATLKLAGIAASLIGAWATYRTMPTPAARAKMMYLFKSGGLYLSHKGHKGREIKKTPKVNRVSFTQDSMQIVFTLPTGMDPGDVEKSDWLFKQGFGENVELSYISAKTFLLNVNYEDISEFDYNYTEMEKALEKHSLPIVSGKSRRGYEVYDMVEHPHLLIAGETGSGKSVQLRSILSTILLSRPNVELYCADLKRTEFHLFKGIAKQVVVEPNRLEAMLMKLQKELRRRGNLLDQAEVAHVDDLKEKIPYIVLAIDEVALLKKEKDIMEIIEEISAIGRALGVFLILSMQRPDADVLDGKLKNNLTVRMAFRHADEINSRITIGTGEAAHIKPTQKGRHYLKSEGLKQVQAPYLDLSAAKRLLAPYKKKPVTEELAEDENLLGVL